MYLTDNIPENYVSKVQLSLRYFQDSLAPTTWRGVDRKIERLTGEGLEDYIGLFFGEKPDMTYLRLGVLTQAMGISINKVLPADLQIKYQEK